MTDHQDPLIQDLAQKCLSLAVYERSRFFKLWNRLDREEIVFESPLKKFLACVQEWNFFKPYTLRPSYQFLSFFDSGYPAIFRELPQPPIGIFVWGRLPKTKLVSVVGSRKPSAYSFRMTRRAVKVWIEAGYAVVSGGAIGIDVEAHRAALDFGGKTISIIGSGFEKLYPATHQRLFEEIVNKEGAVLSEYPPWTDPRAYHFPERNRLIAALGDQLFLAQAHEKSGSLSTARTGLELGKEIYVLRPPLGDPDFKGSQELIEAGAIPLSDPQQLRLSEGLLGIDRASLSLS